jgi:methyltransferase (TIGR00027 family)
MESGGPSITARRVAAHRLGFPRVQAPYGDPAADDALAADVAAGQASTASRMRDYLAARTAFFDRVVVGAIGRGVRQVVIGAAGYDGRAFRYAKPGVRWFEVDHPATQRDKRERVERLGLAARQVRFVEADFTRDPVGDRLVAAGLDSAVPSLFLLEGVAVYLEPAVLETVLNQLRHVAAAGSRLAISVSLSGAASEARSRFRDAVAALGEPARSAFEPDEAGELLARTGWPVVADDPDDPEAAARRERLRSAGLLIARAGPASPSGPAPGSPETTSSPSRPAPGSRETASSPSRPASRSPAATRPASRSSATRTRPAGPAPDPHGTFAAAAPPVSLSALLSQALVAFTIEFDNEAEHQIPHRTTRHGASSYSGGVWLVSMVMWENCMRFVGDEPITVGELERLARTGTNLDGMRRWGYITIDGTAQKVHRGYPGREAVLRATARGLRVRQVWPPLAGLIERRWRDRFGAEPVGRLRHLLEATTGQLDPGLPDCLPIISQVLFSRGPDPALPPRPEAEDVATLPLSALLSRVLLSFALEYESESEVSLAVGANLLRVLRAEGTRLRDLPLLAGISKEAVNWAMGVLIRARLAVEEPDPAASRGKVARLTPAGLHAQRRYLELLGEVEGRWQQRFGADAIGALRESLEALAIGGDGPPPPLFRGLEPHPDNWRASVRPPATLPHYPMVLHRGGYPDGS